jgi:hypothetical protein
MPPGPLLLFRCLDSRAVVLAVTELDVALAAVVAGAVTGIAGVVSPIWLGRKSRAHERDLSRDERLYSDLISAYADAERRLRSPRRGDEVRP